MSDRDPGAPAPMPVQVSLSMGHGSGSSDSFAWALLLAFVACMSVLAFHSMPEKQRTIFPGMLGAAGVTKFIEWVWGAAKNRGQYGAP